MSQTAGTAAARVYGNLLLQVGIERRPNIDLSISKRVVAVGESVELEASIAGGDPDYDYEWSDSCGGTFFGDAPSTYDDASHAVPLQPTLYLGTVPPDAESGTQSDGDALGDDNNPAAGPDDEDGVTFQSFADGTLATFQIKVRVRGTNLTTDPTGAAINGEVEDYRLVVRPTAATIGKIELKAESVDEFLSGLGVDELDRAALLALLAGWDPVLAAALADADRDAILAALRELLDPDGDGQVAVLEWDTLEERGTIGFYVERSEAAGAWIRVNRDMVPGLIDAPLDGAYQ